MKRVLQYQVWYVQACKESNMACIYLLHAQYSVWLCGELRVSNVVLDGL